MEEGDRSKGIELTKNGSIRSEVVVAGVGVDEESIKVPDQSPIEQVALTVPATDDPNEPAITFRTWFLGIICCVFLAFANQFFAYRENPLTITSVSAQIAVLPIGRFMATVLPQKKLTFPGTNWGFSLNPGPFTLKEHVLITIFASAGSGGVYAVGIFTIVEAFYKRHMNRFATWLLVITTQMLGFGWAGIYRKLLVESAYMWWPANLVQVSLFRALHEKDKRPRRGTTRLQFFLIVLICSFAYYVIPGYFMAVISYISVACYIWSNSVKAQQIGSGVYGLGIGSFGVDWNTVASFLGTPLATPWFAIANIMVGFAFIVYFLTPILYWNNTYHAKNFPIIASGIFMGNGSKYKPETVLNAKTFSFDEQQYQTVGQIHLSTFFAFTYGVGFAGLAATVSHVIIFHGRDIWRQTMASLKDKTVDVHTRLMKTNYKAVPQYWFIILLVAMIALSIAACEGFGGQLQLPWWGILFACVIAASFTLPVGVIQATTNQQPGLNIITEYLIGYIYPGRPLANVCFKTYGYISMTQALFFLADFKLGHYMKIPPRSMFHVQIVGTAIASTVYFLTAWWLLETVHDICAQTNTTYTCPGDYVFYNASIIWGVVGPRRVFGNLGLYQNQNWFFLAGALGPLIVWVLTKFFPNLKWLHLVNVPILIGATGNMPPARSTNYIMWGFVGFIFNYVIYRRHKKWWSRHNYILSAGLDAGVAFMGILTYLASDFTNIGIVWWGNPQNAADHCELASCPTAPGIVKAGCPVF